MKYRSAIFFFFFLERGDWWFCTREKQLQGFGKGKSDTWNESISNGLWCVSYVVSVGRHLIKCEI